MSPDAPKPAEILLVEDDPADVVLTRETLADSKILVSLSVVGDGKSALRFLRKEEPYAGAPTPDLVLLDLNLPGLDGRQVLEQIKSDEQLRRLPVVVLTTSEADEDILETYRTGANCYVTKPLGLDEFAKVVTALEDFWLSVVKLPTHASA